MRSIWSLSVFLSVCVLLAAASACCAFKVERWTRYAQIEAEVQEHQAGEPVADPQASGRRALRAGADSVGKYVLLGAKLRLPPGIHRVTYRMKLLDAASGAVARVDMYDQEGQRLPALTIRGEDFQSTDSYQDFTIEFQWEEGRDLEFRCEKMSAAPIDIDCFHLSRRTVSLEGGFWHKVPSEGVVFSGGVLWRGWARLPEQAGTPELRVRVTHGGRVHRSAISAPDNQRVLLADLSQYTGGLGLSVEAWGEDGHKYAEWNGFKRVPPSQPALLAKVINIDYIENDDHTYYFVRPGDLDNDGKIDYLIARGAVQQEARAHDGSLLWKYEDPSASFKNLRGDSEARVYDIDGDGQSEAIVGREFDGKPHLCIVDGKTGRIEKKTPFPGFDNKRDSRACVVIANLRGLERPSDIIAGYDYKTVTAMDNNLNVLWQSEDDLGQHTPKPADVDGDGRDEVMLSAALFDDDGTRLWTQYDLPQIRSVSMGDYKRDDVDSPLIVRLLDKEDPPEIFFSTGGWLLDRSGRTIWGLGEKVYHGQHAEAGPVFQRQNPMGVILVDWRDRGMWGAPRTVTLIDPQGHEVWIKNSEWATMGDWTGDGMQEVFLGDGLIVDAAGSVLSEIPDFFSNVFAHDVLGDRRDEIVLVRRDAEARTARIEIYSNSVANPNAATRDVPRSRDVPLHVTNWTCY